MFFFQHEHICWAVLCFTWNSDPRWFGMERFGLAFVSNGGLLVSGWPYRWGSGLGLALCIDIGLVDGYGPEKVWIGMG